MKKVLMGILLCGLMFGQQTGIQTAPMSTPPPSGVSNTSISVVGTAGNTTYCYWVVVVYQIGMVAPNGPTCINNSNGTLTGGNYNTITWSAPNAQPIGYWVVRNTNQNFPSSGTTSVNATVISSTTFTQNDQSNTLNSFTFSNAATSKMEWKIDNITNVNPTAQLINSVNNTIVDQMSNIVHSVEGSVTIAQINSGIAILPPGTGGNSRVYKIVRVEVQAIGGAFAGCTALRVADTADTSPVTAVEIPVADLTQNTLVTAGSANVVLTTYAWVGGLTSNTGLQLYKTGSSCTTATSLNYNIHYKVN